MLLDSADASQYMHIKHCLDLPSSKLSTFIGVAAVEARHAPEPQPVFFSHHATTICRNFRLFFLKLHELYEREACSVDVITGCDNQWDGCAWDA